MSEEKTDARSESMKGNSNAEIWDFDKSDSFFDEAIALANIKDDIKIGKGEDVRTIESYRYDFIGEIARSLGSYKSIFDYIVSRHPILEEKKKRLIETLEANCYWNGKKGAIKEASSIMNLKSNHKWTDRAHIDGEIKSIPLMINDPLADEGNQSTS